MPIYVDILWLGFDRNVCRLSASGSILLVIMWLNYNADRSTMHPMAQFDTTRVRIHGLQVMDSIFHFSEMPVLTTRASGSLWSEDHGFKPQSGRIWSVVHYLMTSECIVTLWSLRVTLSPLSWSGHVIKMYDNHLPKRIFYGELTTGIRTTGGQFNSSDTKTS